MAFSDHFEEAVINFTGQHRCTFNTSTYISQSIDNFVGKIVCATGEYNDLYDNNKIRVNEAIPIVKLCEQKNDKTVFGVISDKETYDSKTRSFMIGHLRFDIGKYNTQQKFMINSVGEGGIWICNMNGSFSNGDYITTSEIDGYGMLQTLNNKLDDVLRSYTVAKITCDCLFDLESSIYTCQEFVYENQVFKKAFVGCVYCC